LNGSNCATVLWNERGHPKDHTPGTRNATAPTTGARNDLDIVPSKNYDATHAARVVNRFLFLRQAARPRVCSAN
jgi:hypothetical protein